MTKWIQMKCLLYQNRKRKGINKVEQVKCICAFRVCWEPCAGWMCDLLKMKKRREENYTHFENVRIRRRTNELKCQKICKRMRATCTRRKETRIAERRRNLKKKNKKKYYNEKNERKRKKMLCGISRKTSQQNQILSNKQENERKKKKNERRCFSFRFIFFFLWFDSTVYVTERVAYIQNSSRPCIYAYYTGTKNVCTMHTHDMHSTAMQTHTHTRSQSSTFRWRNTQRQHQHLWQMVGERSAHKLWETKTTAENEKRKNNIFFLSYASCRCKTLVANRDEMWYIIWLDKQKLKRK